MEAKAALQQNKKSVNEIKCEEMVLGIEFGSTRIKAVLTGKDYQPAASGTYEWENRFEQGQWTYHEADIWQGLQECYRDLKRNVWEKYHTQITGLRAIGFSGMMHGYLVFDSAGQLLVPFRTWRNTNTEAASEELTALFHYHIPQRWSIAHLRQAILNGETHVAEIDYMTTLAGYVHWKLTNERVLGIGEASGMFPVDVRTKDYNETMLAQFEALVSGENRPEACCPKRLRDIMPKVLTAGMPAGELTEKGALLLDPDGDLQAGIPLCPPEGDAGTGMTATNSVAPRTGNISAGTSVFAMIVLEKELTGVYPEIDLVTTPSGELAAMVHCNNCTSDINAWVGVFREFSQMMGITCDMDTLYQKLYHRALLGKADCGGLLSYGYYSGEHITGFEKGCPLFVRTPESDFNLANFMRSHLFTAMGALKMGVDILTQKERVRMDRLFGHGGFFKTAGVGQRFMAAAFHTPVSVMRTAGEGGAWGIALLAEYRMQVQEGNAGNLSDYLEQKVFGGCEVVCEEPHPDDADGFEQFMKRYRAGLVIERAAVDCMVLEQSTDSVPIEMEEKDA